MDTEFEIAATARTQRITLPVYNLGCGSGATAQIERALTRTPGVKHVYVNPATEMAYVEYDPCQLRSDQVAAIVERAGFGPPYVEARIQTIERGRETRALDTRRLALAAGLWFATLYSLCIGAELLFPTIFHMRVFWEIILIGLDWTNPWILTLGLIEAFLYGLLGVWALAFIYDHLPQLTHR